jgi:hypothetical protein
MNLTDQSPYSASRLDLFASNLLEVSKTTAKDFLLVEPYSIGDAIHSLSLINAFKNKHCINGEKVNFICNVRALAVVKLFRNIDFAIGANLAPHEYQLEALADRYGPIPIGRPIPMPPDMYARGWLSRLCGKGLLTPIDAKKMILELDIDTHPDLPELDKDLMHEMESKASSMGLSSNSIIIFNHANTMKEVDEKIFRPLQKVWKDRIFYDATVEGKGVIEWAKPIKMTIEEVPYFAQYAGFAICIRSGITDLLAFSDTNVITIYPNQSMLFDWSGDKKEVMKGFRNLTLEKLRLSKKAREFPIFCEDHDSVDSIADRLSSLLA